MPLADLYLTKSTKLCLMKYGGPNRQILNVWENPQKLGVVPGNLTIL